ncbi:MAG: molecular chaperone GrpE [Bacteroidia bacterium]
MAEEKTGQSTTQQPDAQQAEAQQAEAQEELVEAGTQDSVGEGEEPNLEEPTLEEVVFQLQEELVGAQDAALRAQADAQNVQRRSEQDVEKARKFALDRFAAELLPVVDNLERALEAASGDDEAIKPIAEGVELTLKSFQDVLAKFNIEVVDPEGEPFDPNLHQAMSMIENPDVEPNSVIAVMQKGYTLNGRLVRPAMVMVSKAVGG